MRLTADPCRRALHARNTDCKQRETVDVRNTWKWCHPVDLRGGAYTQPRNGKGDAYTYCTRCHPGAIQRRWTRELVLAAMREWRDRYRMLPSSYDWSRTHAHRRGAGALKRLGDGDWPPASLIEAIFETVPRRARPYRVTPQESDTSGPTAS